MMNDQGFKKRTIGNGQPVRRAPARPKKPGIYLRIQPLIERGKRWFWAPRKRQEKIVILRKVAIGIVGLGILTTLALWFTLPDIDNPQTMFPSQSTVILDRNGIELYRLFSEEDRTYIQGDQINPVIKKATIAIEDERFFSRSSCFDVTGFGRALLSQIAPSFFVRSGGSTLTQQFAKNALVGNDRSLLRKVRELMLACQLEQRYNKDQLLELYLNWIPFGHNAYGIEQAARNYFNISAKEVSLPQAAVLAGLLQRPSYFNPYGSHRFTDVTTEIKKKIETGVIKTASEIPGNQVQIGLIGRTIGSGSLAVYIGGRTDQVLKNMLDQRLISLEEFNKSMSDLRTLSFTPNRENIRAPHFVLWIQSQVEELLGLDDSILEQGGFRITTTLDWNLQQAAEKVMAAHHDDIRKRFGAHNAALVSLSPDTREILAYVGNADFSDNEHEGKIDMARSPRQPGSSFKPFAYLTAFEAGFAPGSVVYDVPTKFGQDEPQNYDGTFWGLTSMRLALGGSRNIPAIKAFFLGGGEDTLLSLAGRMGIVAPIDQKATLRKQNPDFDYGWPLAIGAAEVPLVEMVQGYATIADGGVTRSMQSLLKITDKDNNIRYLPKAETPVQVIDERYTAEITSILSDVSARPNDYWKSILSVPGTEAATKTGTSNKCLERDTKNACTLRRPESTWTIGYTPNLITGVWVGNATSQSLFDKADGLTTAAPIWHDYMVAAEKKLQNTKKKFDLPEGMTNPLISKLSGQLASACTPQELQTTDIFLEEQTPSENDPACVLLRIDSVTELLSSANCPEEAAKEQAFFVPKSELPNRWPLWEQGVQNWATKQMEAWNANLAHSGSLLPLPLPPTKECDIASTPGRLNKPAVRLLSPSSNEAVPYPIFSPVIEISSLSLIKEVQFFVDNKALRTFFTEPFEGPIRVPGNIKKEGTHILKVRVTDQYLNTVEEEVSFLFE